MKYSLLFVLLAFLGMSFTEVFNSNDLPSRIPEWILKYHPMYDTLTLGDIPIPDDFYDDEIKKVLADSFLITNPTIPLKVQALALQREQVRYGYDWIGVSTGYGLMPGNGNYWEDISFGRFHNEAKKYVVSKLTESPKARKQLYHWASPTLIAVYHSKPDTAQALDMFAVWKATKYLNQYDHQKELERAKKVFTDGWAKGRKTFTYNDWMGRDDSDAKIYAFWHRRIAEYHKDGKGFSLNNALYWSKIAAKDMWDNSSQNAKDIFNTWRTLWEKGIIVAPDRCMLVQDCED